MDEQEFKTEADRALTSLYNKLVAASESEGSEFEADFNSGALSIEFEEPPQKFVISPNTPVRQIWVSAHSKSFKLDWSQSDGDFVLPATGETLPMLMSGHVSEQLGEKVEL